MYSVKDTPQAEWVSPFGNPRVKGCLSPYRGLSQITTSFIASYCLGIHHMRLVAWPYNPKNSFEWNTNSLFSFVQTTCLHSCPIVQLDRVVRRANATLELNQYMTWFSSFSLWCNLRSVSHVSFVHYFLYSARISRNQKNFYVNHWPIKTSEFSKLLKNKNI